MESSLIIGVLVFVLGLAFGSFGNVVIWRLPRGESLSYPASHCPTCDAPIAWHDNVPVASWLMLKGRCRACAARIPVRYPAVELASGLLWVLAWVRFGSSPRALGAILFYYLLLILAAIDLDTYRLPNPLVGLMGAIGVAGIAASMVGLPVLPLLPAGGVFSSPLVSALVGGGAPAVMTLGIALIYERARGREGFGMGDVKLLAAMGPYLGPYTLMVLFLGSMLGAVVGVIAARRSAEGMAMRVPFGPFLAAAAVIVSVAGPAVWHWYAGLLA